MTECAHKAMDVYPLSGRVYLDVCRECDCAVLVVAAHDPEKPGPLRRIVLKDGRQQGRLFGGAE